MVAPYVHPTAVVDEKVKLGEDTRVWHFVHLCEGASVGARCVLGQNVYVGPGVRVGSGVKIQNGVSVYAGVELEDHVFVGPGVTFTNVLRPRAFIERKGEFLPTHVRHGATLGANATILCGLEIGPYAFVAAGAVVTASVPAHGLMVGTPARRTAWVCRCARTLPESDRPRCAECNARYKVDNGACSLLESP